MSVLNLDLKCIGICLVLLLGGCATNFPDESGSVPVEKQPEYTPVTPPPTAPKPSPTPTGPSTSGAYQGLLSKADEASSRGDYEQALALLERAQRIDPDSGEIYLNLAKTYTAKGDDVLAAATAERGLLYCRGSVQCDALRAYTR